MSTLEIAPGCTVSDDSIRNLADNGEQGDRLVTLCVGDRVDGGVEPFLSTNGGPRLIVLADEGIYSCNVDQAADSLGVNRAEVIGMVREACPGIDW